MSNATLPVRPPHASIARQQPAALDGVRRPDRALMWYYALTCIMTGPGIVFTLPYHFFRYRTLRYDFDEQGVTVRWGILFRKEVTLTFARIQDIHLVSNVVERWLGIGRVQIQTASGQSGAEATIEGLHDFEAVRDALYSRMRGARAGDAAPAQLPQPSAGNADVAAALREAAAELRALRAELQRRDP